MVGAKLEGGAGSRTRNSYVEELLLVLPYVCLGLSRALNTGKVSEGECSGPWEDSKAYSRGLGWGILTSCRAPAADLLWMLLQRERATKIIWE